MSISPAPGRPTRSTRITRTRCAIALALLLGAVTARAEGDANERTLSPYFFVEGGDSRTDHLPLLGTHVTVHVAGVIAEVTVRQTYKNDGLRPIHAKYVFPASTRAAVHGLTMTIGNERVAARIKEREEARKDFVAAKKAGKNAALLEEQRPNVFTMDVANIVPGQQIDVELSYSELLVPTAGVYEFVYPTVVGPRYSTIPAAGASTADTWIATPYTPEGIPPLHSLALDGVVSAGMPVHELVSPSHPILCTWANPSRVQFTLDPAGGAGGDRDFVLRYRLEGDRIQSGLVLSQGPDENFFLATIQPPRRALLDEIPPREYIFVVDVSGSMIGFPLNTSKALLRDLIGHLRPTDRFDVLLFSGGSELLSPSSLPATPENVARAVALIDRQQGGGGTELLAALRRAMAIPGDDEARSRSILLITDGYIGAEREVFTSIRDNLGHANVFAFGIGSGVNRYLIEGIARAGMGEPFVAMSPEQAPASAARFREYVQYPLLTNVHVAFEGFEAYDVQPSSVPDVMAERPIVVFGKWRGEPRGQIVVTGSTGAGEFRQSLDVAAAAPDPAAGVLRYLWARARIADLSDACISPETEESKRALVSLGLTYNLLTRHTSFIAVHEAIVNPLADGEDVTQPLPLPAGVSNNAVGGVGVGVGDEPGLATLLAMLLAPALVAGTCLWLRRQAEAAGR
jgi:Ca-activated chloride channel family protein